MSNLDSIYLSNISKHKRKLCDMLLSGIIENTVCEDDYPAERMHHYAVADIECVTFIYRKIRSKNTDVNGKIWKVETYNSEGEFEEDLTSEVIEAFENELIGKITLKDIEGFINWRDRNPEYNFMTIEDHYFQYKLETKVTR